MTGKSKRSQQRYNLKDEENIPVIFQVAFLLAALAHPGHIVS
ncbi:hypothetical protein [Photorhabdus bodei]|nr:hypothetical protein [Photorhabdus bodei]